MSVTTTPRIKNEEVFMHGGIRVYRLFDILKANVLVKPGYTDPKTFN
jgi:hypothetical protein